MRMMLAAFVVALVLGMSAAGPFVVAGDIGPDKNGTLPATLLQAGDIGPDKNG